MRDAISVPRVQALHPVVRAEVMTIIDEIEAKWPGTMKIRIVQGLRTFDEQAAIYAQGRTKPGPVVSNAKPGQTYHNYGLALDFAIMYDKDANGSFEALSWDINYDFDKNGHSDWQEGVKAFKSHGWVWGGDFRSIKDNPHLEKTFGYTWAQLLNKRNGGDVIDGYVRI